MGIASQLTPILGVLVGSLLSYITLSLAAREQWSRSSSIRWNNDRLAAYIDFANSGKTIAMAGLRIAAGRGVVAGLEPQSIVPVSLEEGELLLAEAETSRSIEFEGVLLLGDTATIACAQALNETLWRLEALARSDRLDYNSWRAAFIAYRKARADFYHAARRSIGIPAAEIPLLSWISVGWQGVEPPSQREEGGSDAGGRGR